MILLNKGLTKVTACLALLIVLIGALLIAWSLIVAAGEGQQTTRLNTIKIESVTYNSESRELTLNIRAPKVNFQYNIILLRDNNRFTYQVPISLVKDIVINLSDMSLIIITLKLDDELTNGNYLLRFITQSKLLEYKFNL